MLLASVINPHLKDEIKKDLRVEILFIRAEASPDFDPRGEEFMSRAAIISCGLRTAQQLQILADIIPDSLSALKPYISGLSALSQGTAAQNLNEFRRKIEATHFQPSSAESLEP